MGTTDISTMTKHLSEGDRFDIELDANDPLSNEVSLLAVSKVVSAGSVHRMFGKDVPALVFLGSGEGYSDILSRTASGSGYGFHRTAVGCAVSLLTSGGI